MVTPNKHNRDGSLAMPDTSPSSPTKFVDEDAGDENRAIADFPADQANDLGQVSEEVSSDEFVAQNGGDGARLDDMGIDDLQDQPHEIDVEALTASAREDVPVFDRSIEDTADLPGAEMEAVAEDDSAEDEAVADANDESAEEEDGTLLEEDELSEEEPRVYDVSLDGPGTSDLH